MKQFRGISDVFIAKVLTDTAEGITFDTPKRLMYVARVGKEVSSDSASLFYDNKAMAVINSEGSDEITIEGSALELDILAEITGKTYDETLGMFVDSEREVEYFALGYKEKMLDGSYRYNWRMKGTFAIPAVESNTENDGTDSNGQTVNYTGVYTEAKFAKANNKPAKGIVVTDDKADVSTWFETVQTPDDVKASA